jgi:uncharacterized membrane protein YbhN (UPF0104 family)
LLAPWRELDSAALVGAIILVFVSYGVRAVRVYDYFRAQFPQQLAGGLPLCLHLSLQHNLLNNLLPMRSGELSFPLLMSRYFAVPAKRSLPTLLWFRLLDLHTLALLAALVTGADLIGQTTTLLLSAIWLLLPWLGYRLYRPWLQRIGDRPGRGWGLLRHILHSLPHSPASFWRSWLWTLLNWVIKLAVFAWVLSLFIDIGLGPAWLGATFGDLTSVLPIHGIAGAGTYEAGVVAGLLPFHIAPAAALTAAVNLHLFVLSCTILSGLISLMLPKRIAAAA